LIEPLKKLSVIIVNYNVCHFLEQALTSLAKAVKHVDAEVFVVDNHSVDGSVDMVKEKFPWVQLIANQDNVGFSKANNQAIRQSNAEYVLLLNPDTVVEEDTLQKCCAFMDQHPQAGGLGVKMLDGKGKFLPESKRGLPSPWVAFYKIFGLAKLFPKSKRFGRYHLGFLSPEETNEIDVLSGAFMLLRQTALEKTGLLDEDYFMYGEDIDLSYRILKAGYKNYYYPETRIIHYKGESTKRTSINYVFIFYKAMIIFAQKHFSTKSAGVFSFLINTAIYLRAGFALVNRFIERTWLFMADAAVVYAGMYALVLFWQNNIKDMPGYYPPDFLNYVVPAYVVVWILSVLTQGGYKPMAKFYHVLAGVFIGTFVIAAASNFFDAYRYSKGIIVFGGLWAVIGMLFLRLLIHYVQYGNFKLGEGKKKRVGIVGSYEESNRIGDLLSDTHYKLDVLGYITSNKSDVNQKGYLGYLEELDHVVQLNKLDELIFCSKDISAHRIIEWMTRVDNRVVDFKIVPDESNFIIGSNSSDKRGDFYSLNIELNILSDRQIRNKRLFDISLAMIFLCSFPFSAWFIAYPQQFFRNILLVLGGECTWVGYTESVSPNLPKLKKGILHPVIHLSADMPSQTVYKHNLSYAREYSLFNDFLLVFKGLRYLDR
jgi:GT2 family glycosyltransferase